MSVLWPMYCCSSVISLARAHHFHFALARRVEVEATIGTTASPAKRSIMSVSIAAGATAFTPMQGDGDYCQRRPVVCSPCYDGVGLGHHAPAVWSNSPIQLGDHEPSHLVGPGFERTRGCERILIAIFRSKECRVSGNDSIGLGMVGICLGFR